MVYCHFCGKQVKFSKGESIKEHLANCPGKYESPLDDFRYFLKNTPPEYIEELAICENLRLKNL